ncbi:hypothetical protein Q8F55_004732 [Vanrija albida]|uniref:Aminotransferase class III n=1 Tax=Vanrija albida TaxID=181172 RepID=A0ABR3PZQ1_9TREE
MSGHVLRSLARAPAARAFSSSSRRGALSTATVDPDSKVLHRSLKLGLPMAVRGEGNYIYTADGRKILDTTGGAAVVSCGHAVPEIVDAVTEQLKTLPYVSSFLFGTEPAEELATMLCEESGMSRVVLFNGGSEAVESAIKLARQYHVENGQPQRTKFISRRVSFHGNTITDLALGRHDRRRAMYLPLMPDNVFHAVSPCNPYRGKLEGETDAQYVDRLADELDKKFVELGASTVAAFFMEPVVGATSGCVPFVPGYITAMKRVCEKYGALFVLDEIMCGFGRTGKLHAWSWEGDAARPDIQTLGKGLCGGYAPLSAVLANDKVVNVLSKGTGAFMNGYTFQSSGIGAAAGLAVYKYYKKHDLVAKCAERGKQMEAALRKQLESHPHVGNIRGMGLFYGIELVADKKTKQPFPSSKGVSQKITDAAYERGIALYPGVGCADGWEGDHVMIFPPYTITPDEVQFAVDALQGAVEDVLGKQ